MASEQAAPRRTQAGRRFAAEQALLKAAAEMIAEQGTDRASLRSIGARAGISRAMPAYHFGTKDALITRLAEKADEKTRAAATNALQTDGALSDIPALDAICNTVDSYLALFEDPTAEDRAVIVLWGATFPVRSSATAMIQADRISHLQLVDIIRAGQLDGTIRTGLDPEAAALVIIGMIRGVAAFMLTHPGIADTHLIRSICRTWIGNQLTPS
jgi:AcrR family transcriptional regulator